MPPSIFIALQCCQCSTMQVKQQKKSSNKWTCVVCNEKQSVRKVFAQGSIARDLRSYVQSFNMSRKIADEQADLEETVVPAIVEDASNQKKKRRDWTEYIDTEQDGLGNTKEEEENVYEPKVVTELPRELFKKPKLKDNSVRSSVGEGDGFLKPVFSKRNFNKQVVCKDVRSSIGEGDDGFLKPVHINKQVVCKGTTCEPTQHGKELRTSSERKLDQKVSKWNDYVTQEDYQNPQNWGNGVFANLSGQCSSNDVLETIGNDHMVEEDIHPDFM